VSLLELREVAVHFGGLRALDDLSFAVEEGEILGLIGPNGSGKSTAFNVITGVIKANAGSILFDGEDITGQPPHRVAHRGISRTFQLVRPFAHLSALDNVLVGTYFGAGRLRGRKLALEHAHRILGQVGLEAKAGVHASELTILERKWLEVGRALAGSPRLILLDEFMAGISEAQVPEAVSLVQSINGMGVTVVVVEDNTGAPVAARCSPRAHPRRPARSRGRCCAPLSWLSSLRRDRDCERIRDQ
jgi:branched-chain amino acid transport system ATP-binding protein